MSSFRRSSFVRRALGAGLAFVCVPVAALSAPGIASATSGAGKSAPTAAQAGAGWIGRQFEGRFIATGGSPDPSSTALAVLAFVSAGVGGTKARAAVSWLEKHYETYVRDGGVVDAGALATVVLVAQAMGVDPTKFGGSKPANDLVARLLASQQTTGPDAGLFGTSDPTFDGAFRQGLALMALANQGRSRSTAVARGVAWLQHQQCGDGGWEAYRSAPTTPCPAPDPSSFTGPDTNSTALAVEGLVAAGASFPADPTTFFESAQNPDGGFGFIGASSQSPDPDSTGEVIQALAALGQLTNPAFTQSGGATPLTALASFQLGCSAAEAHRGAYRYPGESGPNMLATLQAVPGAAERAFPLKPQSLQPGLPELKCPAH